jgi:radical SAM superfamily enzyme YgiQ (UPF0313 family)
MISETKLIYDLQADAFFRRYFPLGISRVLLVNPPDADSELFRVETARRGRYTNYPPYGLAALAQNLRAIGVDVHILNLNHLVLKAARQPGSGFDFNRTWQEALAEEIETYSPDLVGVTCMFTMTHLSLRRVCEFAERAGAVVAIGGVHVTNDVERVLDDVPHARVAFLREGDVALKNFVAVANGQMPYDVLGQVILDDGSQRLRFLGERQPTEDEIDLVPAYDLCDTKELSDHGTIGAFYCFKPPGAKFATVLSNRGCRAMCTFCSVRNFNGKRVRQRSVNSVLDELQLLEEVYGIEHVMWLDDDLLKDHARAIELFDGKVRRGLKMTWDATNGLIAASCTEEVVAAMAASGCIAVNIGMESGSPEILRMVKKPGTVKNFVEAADTLRKYPQIHSSVFLMVGFPGETMRQVMETIKVAKRMDLDWYRISPVQPLPNTPMYDAMVEQGLVQAVGSRELRFMGGAYGKQAEIEQGQRMTTASFRDAFAAIPLDAVPSEDQVTDIWFYMNYHLNFQRLFHEDRPEKVAQQFAHLRTLSDVISPENGFALYFTAYLQCKQYGMAEPEVLERLARRLETSPYWRDRFEAFDLRLGDLNARPDAVSPGPGREVAIVN